MWNQFDFVKQRAPPRTLLVCVGRGGYIFPERGSEKSGIADIYSTPSYSTDSVTTTGKETPHIHLLLNIVWIVSSFVEILDI